MEEMKVGEELEVVISSLGKKGDGVAKTKDGYTIIIPDTAMDTRYLVKIVRVFPNYAFATVVKAIGGEEDGC